MRARSGASLTTMMILSVLAAAGRPQTAPAAPITFSGTVSYQGSYAGDTLYVGVLDTTGTEDVTILDLEALPVGPPPFNQPYSLNFDNAGVSPTLLVASFLDVDGGGVDSLGEADVFGWYNGGTFPAGISSASSQSGLDFALPRAEIRGTIIFDSGQTQARLNVSPDVNCQMDGFRPTEWTTSPGPYSIIVYAGTYCVSADGNSSSGPTHICYGDPSCTSPTLVTLSTTQVVTGVDLDFSGGAPVEKITWGRVKALYP